MLEPVDVSDEEREAIDAAGADTDDGGETTIRSRPIIVVHPGTLSERATLGEAAIIAGGAQVYRRGEALVRPVIEEVDASDGRRTKVAQLAEIETHYLRDLLCRSAKWKKFDSRKRTDVPTNPPMDVAQIIVHRYGEWKFLPIAGVVTTPTMRPDGSLLLQEGYDAATRLILLNPDPGALTATADRKTTHTETWHTFQPGDSNAFSSPMTPSAGLRNVVDAAPRCGAGFSGISLAASIS